MGRNIFDIELVMKEMDKQAGRKVNKPEIKGNYEIELTGLDGWMTYRYQYQINNFDYFGYAETIEEARANIIKGQEAK